MKTSARRDMILKYIVEDFIQTAEPVGSKNLLSRHDLQLSSATVRNVMAELEKEGLIEKTHTSSGRVPSTAGYRYYLEHLTEDEQPDRDQALTIYQREFSKALNSRTRSVESNISSACQILSEVTSLATMVLGDSAGEEKLVSVTITPISERCATVVLITDQGHVESKTFDLPKGTSMNAIDYGMQLLNARLKGTKLCELESKVRAIEPILKTQVGRDFQVVIQAFLEAFLSFSEKRFKSFGGTKLMGLPEFDDDGSFRRSVNALLGEGTPPPRSETVKAKVGKNTAVELDPGNDISIVRKRIDLPGITSTDIAVVGPTRMDYRRVIDAMNALVDQIMKLYGVDPADIDDEEEESPEEPDNTGETEESTEIEIEEGRTQT